MAVHACSREVRGVPFGATALLDYSLLKLVDRSAAGCSLRMPLSGILDVVKIPDVDV